MLSIYVVALVLLGLTHGEEIGPPGFSPEPPPDKPFGAYYCQARCLASCLETFLAPSLEDCQKFCPPFEDNMPCPPDNAQCWQTCGVPVLANDPPAPDSPDLTPVILGNDREQDPFVIELTWSAVPNASLYIVEFFPQNRTPKPGESNFFQVMTTSLTYKVRKDDECVEYSGRVIAVSSYGISQPTYAFIGAPTPSITPANTHFIVRNMQRDPFNADMITVTIDYALPNAWPLDDIDISTLRVSSLDCRGPLGDRSFGNLAAPEGGSSNPSYTGIIGKTPTTAIQLSFFDDMLLSNCFVQMRIASVSTRCNTTVNFEEDLLNAPGVDFRINCETIPGACIADTDNETIVDDAPTVLAPIPIPASIAVDPEVVVPSLNPPGQMPPGIDKPEEATNNTTDEAVQINTPNPWALLVGQQGEPNVQQPMPPGGRVSIVDIAPNGTDALTMAVIPEAVLPPMCELEMIDAEPALSALASSLIDMKVMWLERQPLPPPPPASYFVIRYGPIIRRLVDDERQANEIIPGYETIVRTGQTLSEMPFLPDPVREVNITGLQRGSLLKIQICAIYDPSSEAMIQWDFVNSRRIDLAALEPFLDFEGDATAAASVGAVGPVPPPLPANMVPADMVPVDMMAPVDMWPVDMSPLEMVPSDPGNEGISAIDLIPVGSMMVPDIDSAPMDPMDPMDPDSEATDPDDMGPVELSHAFIINVEEHKTTPLAYWMTVLAGLLLIVLTVMLILVFLRRLCMTRRHHMKQVRCEKPMVIVTTPAPKPTMTDMIKVPLA